MYKLTYEDIILMLKEFDYDKNSYDVLKEFIRMINYYLQNLPDEIVKEQKED